MNADEILTEAAAEARALLFAELEDDKGVHIETLVASAARLAGSALLQSFHFDLAGIAPGAPVFSDAANDRGPALLNVLGGALQALGVKVDSKKVTGDFAPEHAPLMDMLETLTRLQPKSRELFARHGLDEAHAAKALTLTTAMIIRETQDFLDPVVSFNLAAFGLVEGSKTAPP